MSEREEALRPLLEALAEMSTQRPGFRIPTRDEWNSIYRRFLDWLDRQSAPQGEPVAWARDALKRLLDLKDYKDANGKDEHYEREQPLAWNEARAALNLAEHYAFSPSAPDAQAEIERLKRSSEMLAEALRDRQNTARIEYQRAEQAEAEVKRLTAIFSNPAKHSIGAYWEERAKSAEKERDALYDRLKETEMAAHKKILELKDELRAQLEAKLDVVREALGDLRFPREQWGIIIDGLVLECERALQRKNANRASTSDVRAAMCRDMINKIRKAALQTDHSRESRRQEG